VLDGVGTLARLGLAAVWLVSGAVKAADPNGTYAAVQAYDLFPTGVASLVAAVLPFLELALGLLVLAGIGVRLVGVLSGLVLIIYIAGIAQSWARGLTIDCGCFGNGGQVAAGQTHYPEEILRDIGFFGLAVWLAVRPTTWASADVLLRGRRAVVDHDADRDAAGTTDDGKDADASGAGRDGDAGRGNASTVARRQ
jgi:uncharacterized membrane protein YphA (DoxX/SURF4 family)